MKHRCLIFGGRGFVGNAIGEQLSNLGYDIKLISRSDFDFIDKDARFKAQREIKDGDIVVLAAAIAPAKDIEMVFDNIRLTNNLVEATREKKISYLLNVSSDAVYGDLDEPLEESSLISPLNAHGVMHVMRERMIEQRVNSPIGHIRPTLIFGASDPHNGYGPNKFLRQAQSTGLVQVFGNGEEQRDHIHVDDVAFIASKMIERRIEGPINAATGHVTTFMEIAELACKQKEGSKIVKMQRSGPMPHNGYRAFDTSKLRAVIGQKTLRTVRTYFNEA